MGELEGHYIINRRFLGMGVVGVELGKSHIACLLYTSDAADE